MNRLSGIHFLDGPAKRVELQLRRAPLMLRVTTSRAGHWDALDQIEDDARPSETIHVYWLATRPTYMFIRATGGMNGMWACADYVQFPESIDDENLRGVAWLCWCAENQARVIEMAPKEIFK